MPKRKYNTIELPGIQHISFEERIDIIRKMAAQAEVDFQDQYKEINNWFTQDYDPLHILSLCMRYFLMDNEGYDEEAETGGLSFAPHYLEILQAISLSHERVISARPMMEDAEKLRSDMKSIGQLISTKLHKLPEKINDQQELHKFQLKTDVAGYNMAVRNWAYYFQMLQVGKDVAALVKEEFLKYYNIDPVVLMTLFFEMGNKVEERINIHNNKLHKALAKGDYKDIQIQYDQIFGLGEKDRINPEFLWDMSGKDMTILRALLISHSDLRLPELFSFTIDELLELAEDQLDRDALIALMNNLSYEFGDLKGAAQEYMILDNPVHNRPFIKIEDNTYYTSLWTSVPHLALNMLEYLVESHKSLKECYVLKRALYLESEVSALFQNSFEDAKVFRGSMYVDEHGKNGENDLLIIVDSFAIVVECKAGGMTKAAKRGAPDRLHKTLEELVENPSSQALRFIEYLKKNKTKNTFHTKGATRNEVDLSQVKYFIPLGITFYHLGTIGANLKLIIDAGITDKPIQELAPSISLTDLQIIFSVLKLDAQKIHYLHRRREFDFQISYRADELDLLGFYLETMFNIGDKEVEGNWIFDLSLHSKVLDPYFIAQHVKRSPVTPQTRMTKWWVTILERLSSIKTPRWLEISYVLLNLNEGDQEQLENGFKEVVGKLKNGQIKEERCYYGFFTANKDRQYAVIICPYKNIQREQRNEILTEALDQVYDENPKIKGVVAMGVNIDQGHYPYSNLMGYLSDTLFDSAFSNMAL